MKLLVIFFVGIFIQNSFAYKVTDQYVIFEKGDKEASDFIGFLQKTYSQMGLTPLERNDLTEEMYQRLDEINRTLHETYLAFFKTNKETFPLPYVIFDRGHNSANFGAPVGMTYKTSNFITISFSHVKSEKALWSVLAHEIAHYYHNHMKSNNFLRASYTDHRVLTEENGYGENIEHDTQLAQTLEDIMQAARRFVGGGATVTNLTKLRIGPSDPVMYLIPRVFSDLFTFDRTEELADLKCYSVRNKIIKLATDTDLSLAAIREINNLSKECPVTKNTDHFRLAQAMFGSNVAYAMVQSPRLYTKHADTSVRTMAQSIDRADHPIASALHVILSYRTELKRLVESIQWDKLQYYTKENEADITSFKILNELGLAHYQDSFLDLVFNKNKCVESLENAAIEIEYYSHSELDTHNSLCWRIYRTRQMLSGIKKINKELY